MSKKNSPDRSETDASTVFVRQLREPLSVSPGETILEAALSVGEVYPHGCRIGQCGACKSVLIEGMVKQRSGFQETALTTRERGSALFLACCAEPQGTCEVAMLDRREPARFPAVRANLCVVSVEQVTPTVKKIDVETRDGEKLFYEPGQFATLTFQTKEGALPARDYSMAVPCDDNGVSRTAFYVGHDGVGPVSRYIADTLTVGSELFFHGPFGVSYLRRRREGPILLAGGGTGLAPLLAIAESCVLESKTDKPIMFLVQQKTPLDHYALDRLTSLAGTSSAIEVRFLVDDPSPKAHSAIAFEQRSIEEIVASEVKNLAGWQCYFAGPPGLVANARKAVLARGARPGDCHSDAFIPTAAKNRRGQQGLRTIL